MQAEVIFDKLWTPIVNSMAQKPTNKTADSQKQRIFKFCIYSYGTALASLPINLTKVSLLQNVCQPTTQQKDRYIIGCGNKFGVVRDGAMLLLVTYVKVKLRLIYFHILHKRIP